MGGWVGGASSTQHHQKDGPTSSGVASPAQHDQKHGLTSSLGHAIISMSSGGLIVEVGSCGLEVQGRLASLALHSGGDGPSHCLDM